MMEDEDCKRKEKVWYEYDQCVSFTHFVDLLLSPLLAIVGDID